MLNLSTLKTPGVYIDEVALLPPSVAGVETSIPAFIGYTEKADEKVPGDLNMTPKKIRSLKDFEAFYGKVAEAITVTINDTTDAADKLVSRNLVVAVTPAKRNMYYQMQMFFANGGSTCYVVSVGQGAFDTAPDTVQLEKGLDEVNRLDEPTLLVFPDAMNGTDENKVYALYQTALMKAGELKDRFVVMDVKNVDTFRGAPGIGTENLKYGAAYYPNLRTLLAWEFIETTVAVEHKVVKDGGAATDGDLKGKLDALRGKAVYGEIKQKINESGPELSPSSAVVGVYAAVDANRGVWKAPANVSISKVLSPSVLINDLEQRDLNVDVDGGKSINVIRNITGRGTVIWGARTLDGNDNEWRYVPVRRFFNFVEESVKKATYRFVFEPNDANTWVKVRAMVENFLTLQWRAGALMGAKTEHAYFVRVGLGQTMTVDDVLNGRLIIEIGMAVVRPAEFIVLRFMHKLPES